MFKVQKDSGPGGAHGGWIKRIRSRVLVLAAAALMASCGGGGDSGNGAGGEPEKITATVVAKAEMKVLTSAQAAATTFPTVDSVALPAGTSASVGDVVAIGTKIVKLTEVLPAAPPAMTFKWTKPHIDDLYSSIKLNGTVSGPVASDVGSDLEDTQAITSCGGAEVIGLDGRKCTFAIKSKHYPSVSVEGTYAAGHKVAFDNWDAINNTGSGKVMLSFDGDIALMLSKESSGTSIPDDTCNSVRAAVAGTRVRLFTIPIATTVPGVTVRIPVCLAFDANLGISGKIFKLTQKSIVTVAVGNSEYPSVTQKPSESTSSKMANGDDKWTIDNTSALETSTVEANASAELMAEIGFEVTAGSPTNPKLSLVDVGLVASIIGKGSVDGKVAPAVTRLEKSISEMAANPLYCLQAGLSVNFDLTAYASLPAFKTLGIDVNVSKSILKTELWKYTPEDLGLCDFKVLTETAVVGSPNPGRTVTFNVSVKKSDPSTGKLWDDIRATGSAPVKSGSGALLCTAQIKLGVGSCVHKYGGEPRTESIQVSYKGDDHFRPSLSSVVEQRVDDPVPTGWEGTMTVTACTQQNEEFATWVWEVPCFNTGPYAGAFSSRFYFSDDENLVILESSIQGRTSLRRSFPVRWRSTEHTFSLSIPSVTVYSFPGDTSYRTHTTSRDFLFTVTERTTSEISGTFTIRATSGLAGWNSIIEPSSFKLIPTVTSGTWRAFRASQLPNLRMNGYDLCLNGNEVDSGMYYLDVSKYPFTPGAFRNSLNWSEGAGQPIGGECFYE